MPLRLVAAMEKNSTKTAKGRCLGGLIHIALYFCRTTQFRFRDLQFHDTSVILPFDALASRIRGAPTGTLYLDNKKNSIREEYITLEATGITFGCAVGTSAERFLHLRPHCVDLDTPICT